MAAHDHELIAAELCAAHRLGAGLFIYVPPSLEILPASRTNTRICPGLDVDIWTHDAEWTPFGWCDRIAAMLSFDKLFPCWANANSAALVHRVLLAGTPIIMSVQLAEQLRNLKVMMGAPYCLQDTGANGA